MFRPRQSANGHPERCNVAPFVRRTFPRNFRASIESFHSLQAAPALRVLHILGPGFAAITAHISAHDCNSHQSGNVTGFSRP
jgi:hypothetical protein